MVPQVFGLVRDMFAAEEMGKAFAVFGPVMGLSAMLGPVIAGGLISVNVFGTGWRMIFLVNLPIGIAPWSARVTCPTRRTVAGFRLDLPGAALASPGDVPARVPAGGGPRAGLAALDGRDAGGVGASARRIRRYQVRRQRAGRPPLIEPSIFSRRAYASGMAFSLVFIASLGGIVMIFNVFLQAGLGFSPWHSALTTAPWAAGAFVGSGVGGVSRCRSSDARCCTPAWWSRRSG